MKRIFFALSVLVISSTVAFGQKGVDTQTQKIRQESNRGTQMPNNPGGGFDFGKDKTKVRERLDNPYRLSSRRDMLVETIVNVLKERKLLVDENSSRASEGVIITQPFIFAKGAVITKNELNRYAELPDSDTIWRSGRYSLRIEIEPIDGVHNNVSVTAKVDGKSENGLISEWTSLQSTGLAEDEFLVKLIEAVTGNSPDDPKDQ